MKNFKYKVLISILVFVAVAVVTIVLTRATDEVRSGKVAMSSSTLPVVYMISEEGHEFNLLHGYVTNIDESMLHECITPLPEGRKLRIGIGTYGQNITGISYEIRSLDGSQYIENTTVTDYSVVSPDEASKNTASDDGTSDDTSTDDNTSGSQSVNDANTTGNMGERVEAVLNIKNLLEEDTEYMLKISVSTEKKTASYYTRIVLGDGLYLDDKLDYVLHFSEVTYDSEAIKEIIPKLEPNSSGDNTNLGHVNIHSKLSQVGWGALEPEYYGKIWPRVVEIQGNTADIRLDYQVSTSAARGIDVYDVKEFFRIRRADADTTYVLGYDRYVDQIFDGFEDLNDSGRIYLGITSGLEELSMKSDSSGRVTCFVRGGELWSYNSKSNQFVQLFTFGDSDTKYDSVRETYDEHGIKILSVDADGNVSYVVYGYMNRGSHEGEMGVSVCRYDAEKNAVDEILYIPRNDIYDVIKKDVETLAYLNSDGRFFMYQGGSIYSIYYDTKEYMVVSSQVIESSCIFSQKYSMFAYQEGTDENHSDAINIIYLDTGETAKIEAADTEYIKILGLIDGNIIYGKADKSEIYDDRSDFYKSNIYDESDTTDISQETGDYSDDEPEQNNVFYPFLMYRIEIVNGSLELIKDYEKSGVRVIDVEADSNKLVIKRVAVNEDGSVTDMSDDQLLSTTMTPDGVLTTRQVATEVRQKELYIILTVSVPSSDDTKVVYPKSITFNGEAQLYMSEVVKKNEYYRVYVMGKLALMTDKPGEAIALADEQAGVVVAPSGDIIWDRYKKNTAKVSLTESYSLGELMDISGANLDEALYYIHKGYVLRVGNGEGQIVIYAYDNSNAAYMSEGISHTVTKSELEGIIAQNGGAIYVCDVIKG